MTSPEGKKKGNGVWRIVKLSSELQRKKTNQLFKNFLEKLEKGEITSQSEKS